MSWCKTSLKLSYIEHRVYGYILVARRVLYMAGSLRYRRIKHSWFNAHSVQCKNTPYAHCMPFFLVKYTCLQNFVAFTLPRICVESRVFYPTISQRSCICTALYLLPNSSLALYFRYTRVLSCFFNIILYSKQVNFIRDKWIQCALTLLRMRVKTRVFYPTILKRSCYIQHSQIPVIQRTFCAM